MAHRCTYGIRSFEVFVGKVNSDQTEGRGPMRDHSLWDNANDAYEAIRGQGVMGVGDGDVAHRVYYTCDADDTGEVCHKVLVTEDTIYDGWAARGGNRKGFGPDGWRPDYSPLLNDPDYKTYLRLKERFEG
jgi:hypothetical protein